MSTWRKDYTITTLSSSLSQYETPLGQAIAQAPYWFGVHSSNPASLRARCLAYIATGGDPSAIPCRTPGGPAPATSTLELLFITSSAVVYTPTMDYSLCGPCDCTNMKAISSSGGTPFPADYIKVANLSLDDTSITTVAMWVYPTSGSSATGEDITSLFGYGKFNPAIPTSSFDNLTFWVQRSNSGLDAPTWWLNPGSGSVAGPTGFNWGKFDEWNLVLFSVSDSDSDSQIIVVTGSGGAFGTDWNTLSIPGAIGTFPATTNAYIASPVAYSGVNGGSPPTTGSLVGQIDDMAIWENRWVSGSEVTDLFNCAQPLCLTSSTHGFSSSLTHWWSMGDGLNDVGGNGGIIYDLIGTYPTPRNARIYTSGALNIVNLVSGTDAIYCSGSPHPTTPPPPETLDMIGPWGTPPRYIYQTMQGPELIAGAQEFDMIGPWGTPPRYIYQTMQGPELIYGPINIDMIGPSGTPPRYIYQIAGWQGPEIVQ